MRIYNIERLKEDRILNYGYINRRVPKSRTVSGKYYAWVELFGNGRALMCMEYAPIYREGGVDSFFIFFDGILQNYPSFDRVLSNPGATCITTFKKESMLDALKTLMIKGNPAIRLNRDDKGELYISNMEGNFLPIIGNTEEREIGRIFTFKDTYLIDILNAISSKDATVSIGKKPGNDKQNYTLSIDSPVENKRFMLLSWAEEK